MGQALGPRSFKAGRGDLYRQLTATEVGLVRPRRNHAGRGRLLRRDHRRITMNNMRENSVMTEASGLVDDPEVARPASSEAGWRNGMGIPSRFSSILGTNIAPMPAAAAVMTRVCRSSFTRS